MENNLENKAKLFALYWGQKVFRSVNDNDDEYEVDGLYNNISTDYLELKPLSSISDEDLIKCYHLHSAFIGYDYTMDFKPVADMAAHWFVNGGLRDIQRCPDIVDCLRSKGYALPWMGLSVEELINRGWIRFKKGE